MRKRKNTIEELKNKAPKNLLFKVYLLEEEIRIFFENMSMYENDTIYIELYISLYTIYPPITYLDLSMDMHINEKTIKKFIKKTENYISSYIENKIYFKELLEYTHK